MVGPIISRNRYLPGVNHCLPARTLLDLDVNMICPAHGEAFDVTRSDLERHRDWADAVAVAVRRWPAGTWLASTAGGAASTRSISM